MSKMTSIGLPAERLEQLKEIAVQLGGMNMADTIGKMARELAMRDVIALNLPGLEVLAASNGVCIKIEDNERTEFLTKDAIFLVEKIREFVQTAGRLAGEDHSERGFKIDRISRSVRISIPADGEVKSLNRELAFDFAQIIEDALKKVGAK